MTKSHSRKALSYRISNRQIAVNRLVLIASVALLPAAAHAQAPHVEHLKHGDTSIVRTTGNGVWGAPHAAIEVKRIGGESKETTFDEIGPMVALPNGGVILLDQKALDGPTIRMFDRDGKFVRNVGHIGDGPGEFKANGQDGFAVAPNGTILLRRSDGLINRYRADGTFINTFRYNTAGGGRLDFYPGPGNSVYARGGARPNTDMAEIVVRRYDTTGKVLDSLNFRRYLAKPPASNYDPLEWWFPLPDGRILATRTDRLGFLLRAGPDHRVLLLADVPGRAPLYLPDERAELQASADISYDQDIKRGMSNGPRPIVPERKPVSRSTELSVDGTVWVRLRTTGVKGEAHPAGTFRLPDGTMKRIMKSYSEPVIAYSAFRLDGTHLGDVQFPDGTEWITFVGNYAWGMVVGADDQPMLAKFKLPGGR